MENKPGCEICDQKERCPDGVKFLSKECFIICDVLKVDE